MKTIRQLGFFLVFSIFTLHAAAQDAVVIDTGNFVRGTIQGTNYMTVAIKKDDGSTAQYDARDIKEFLWNGVTFVSKPFMTNNQKDSRFFKLLETGPLNLYAMGGTTVAEKKRRRVSFTPSFGIGVGTGGYSGVGIGGGISFGGRRNEEEEPRRERRALYYIERPGTGEMLEITPDNQTSEANTEYIRKALLEKMSDDSELADRISKMDTFDVKSIQSLVKTYNSAHQQN